MIYAAGIMLIDPNDKILFLKRSKDGYWDYSGGLQEEEEDPFDTAANELNEETGFDIDGHEIDESFTCAVGRYLIFTTFVARIPGKFKPTLSDEHEQFVWLTPEDARVIIPLLPGVVCALDILEEE